MSTLFPANLDDFLNPTPTTVLDGSNQDPRVRHSKQHTDINDSLEAVETKVGVDFSSVNTSFDYIINLLLLTNTQHNKGVRRDITGQPFPTSVVWFADSLGTIKLVEKQYTYDSRKNITKVELFLYDGSVSNVLKRTITDNITLSGPFETTRSRVIS